MSEAGHYFGFTSCGCGKRYTAEEAAAWLPERREKERALHQQLLDALWDKDGRRVYR